MRAKNEKKMVTQMMKSANQNLDREFKKQSWKPFFQLIRSVKLPWILIIVCTVIQLTQSYLTLLFPQYTEEIYAGNFSSQLAVTAVLVVLGKSLLTSVFQFIGNYTSRLNHMRFQNYIWRKLSRLPLSYYEKHEPRELISRTTEDTLTLSEFLVYSISSILSSFVTFIGSFVLIFGYDWRLALSQAIALPLCYVIGVIAGRIYFKLNNRIQGRISDMTRYFAAILPYLTLVKLFGQEKREEQNGNIWIESYAKTSFDNAVTGCAISFANTLTSVLQQIIVILMGVWLVREGSIDIGVWIAFYMYANTLSGSMQSLMNLWQSIKRNQGACARVSAAISETPEENPGTLDAKKAQGNLEFDHVSFAYEEKNVLNDISFTAEEGKVTAIVGPSGAGKSTLLSLVERFYEPGAGKITLGGKESREYDLYSWRRAIAYIPQDTQLVSGTIRDNIRYGVDDEVSDARIEEAAKQADAYEFILSFEDGFDTEVGENGCKLSGGQRQRIAIARALLRDSRLLVVDEMTSNLDAESGCRIDKALKSLAGTHTILMVAHHMDTVKDADKIIVMDQTRVNGQGTHEELMKENELYRHLVELDASAVTE